MFSHLGKKNWQWRSGHGHFPEWRKKRYFFSYYLRKRNLPFEEKKTPRKRETVKLSHIIRNCVPQTHAQMHGPTIIFLLAKKKYPTLPTHAHTPYTCVRTNTLYMRAYPHSRYVHASKRGVGKLTLILKSL